MAVVLVAGAASEEARAQAASAEACAGAVSAECVDYAVGAPGDQLDFSTLPGSWNAGGVSGDLFGGGTFCQGAARAGRRVHPDL